MSFLSFRSVGPSLSIRGAFPLEGAVTLERNARAAEDVELTPSPMGSQVQEGADGFTGGGKAALGETVPAAAASVQGFIEFFYERVKVGTFLDDRIFPAVFTAGKNYDAAAGSCRDLDA